MTRETIILTHEEQRRVRVLSEVREGRLAVTEATHLLGLSVRHTRRLVAAFRRHGPAALAHGNRGRPPHNRLPAALRQRVLRLARTAYVGFNHQHLTEALVEERGLSVSYWTVHRWLVAAGLPSPRPRRPRRYRRRRERMPQEGLLLQFDASQHTWLEGRGPRLVLHGAIDDASNRVPAALFRAEEDTYGYFWVLRTLVHTHGRPVAIYSDRHGIFRRDPRQPLTLAQQLRGLQQPPTQFGRALQDLGIRWIPASSPQAKGRIERLWGTFQDRLVSELRRARARTVEEANAVLARFLPRYNTRFAQAPAAPTSAYRPLAPDQRLEDICAFAYERTVANDNTVRLGEHLLQILPDAHRSSYAQARVVVREHLDGSRSVSYKGERLRLQAVSPRSPLPAPAPLRARGYRRLTTRAPAPRAPKATRTRQPRRSPSRPAAAHPWRRAIADDVYRQRLRKARVTLSLNI